MDVQRVIGVWACKNYVYISVYIAQIQISSVPLES